MARKMYVGNAPATTLNGGINSTTSTIAVTSGTGYPSGGSGNFWIVIDRGLSAEEKILCSNTTGNTITAVDRTTAGNRDGTTNATHVTGASVEHCFTAQDADEANDHINTVANDHHTQYILVAGTRAFTGVTAIANSTPTTSAVGDAAAIGTGNVLARSTHVHGREAFAAPVAPAVSGNSTGAAATVNHSDHVHQGTGTLGYTPRTTAQSMGTSVADVTSLAVTVTTISGRRYKLSLFCPCIMGVLTAATFALQEGGTSLAKWDGSNSDASSGQNATANASVILTPSAASHTYKVTGIYSTGGAGSLTFNPSATNPAYILIEDIGV